MKENTYYSMRWGSHPANAVAGEKQGQYCRNNLIT